MRDILNNFFIKIYRQIKKLTGYDYHKWSLAILDKKNFEIKCIFLPPKNEFWADPFYFKFKNKDFVFFEKFSYFTKKGEIVCAEIKDNKLINFKTVLKQSYHLSFPNIFKYKKKIFMVPETHQNKKLEIYICKKFPDKWSLYSSAFLGEIICDPLIFFKKNKIWLFVNKTNHNLSNLNKDLFIYQIDSLKLKKITPHEKNPVISNFNGGRNAAQKILNNKPLIRVSQNCKSLYGEFLNISKIKRLTLKDYSEKKIKTIKPVIFNDKNIIGIHSLSEFKDKYLVDILFEFKR